MIVRKKERKGKESRRESTKQDSKKRREMRELASLFDEHHWVRTKDGSE